MPRTFAFPLRTLALLSVLVGPIFAETDLREADAAFAAGRGKEALAAYLEVIEGAPSSNASMSDEERARLAHSLSGLFRCAMRYGDPKLFDRFERQVTDQFPDQPVLQTQLGRLREHRGDYAGAMEIWERVVEAHPDLLEPRFRLLELRERYEDPEELKPEYQSFLDRYNQSEKLTPEDLEWVGRACVKVEKYEWDGAQKAYQEALDASPTLESVLIAKGDLWLDRYDPEKAIEIYASVFKTNPESIDAALEIARTHRENGNFAGLKNILDQVLAIHPEHPLALGFMADVYFYDIEYDEGQKYLDRAFKVNPNHPMLLAIQATYAVKRKDFDLVKKIEEKVADLFPNPAEYHFLVADCLQRNYLFVDADREYGRGLANSPGAKRAIAARAMLQSRVSPASAEAALETMREAFSRDAFHVRLHNMRNLFAKRAEFEVEESEHFRVRFPPGAGSVYGIAALEALEEAFADLSVKFPYRPAEKVIVEFYENPTDFSLRISGLPGTGLSGVCFGDILILKAPDPRNPEAYNWGNTLRHELVHMFSLGLSDHRTPRWYTEGLSVAEEWDPNIQADTVLVQKHRSRELFPLEEFDRAFHRPEGMAGIWIAYQQSGDAVRFLTERFGFEVHLKLLAEFAKGADTPQALSRETRLSLDRLNEGVHSQIGDRVRKGLTPHQLAALRTAESPDATAEAKLAPRELAQLTMDRSYLKRDWKGLAEAAEEWLADHPEDLPFLEGRALAAYELGDKRGSRKTVEEILSATKESFIAHHLMAQLHRDFRRWDEAVGELLKAHDLLPRNIGPGSPIREAEAILEERRDWKRLYEVVAQRLRLQPTDAAAFRTLAAQALDRGALDVGREAVRQAVFIHPFDSETQILWGKVLLEEGKVDEAVGRFETARTLDPHGGRPLLALAEARLESGSREGAVSLAEQALALDPTLEEARDLIQGLP